MSEVYKKLAGGLESRFDEPHQAALDDPSFGEYI